MRCDLLTLFVVALLTSAPLLAQTPVPAQANEAAIVAFAEEATIRALNFKQGDIGGLTNARPDFTPEGWNAFMKHIAGWLDPKGAPTFSSSFVPSGSALVVGEKNGILYLKIPGTLKQMQRQSSTTYRATIEVQAGGEPIKIQHLEQTTCLGSSTNCK